MNLVKLNIDNQFLDLSSQGLTRLQIAVRLGILSKDLLSHLSPGVYEKGCELCQAFHEDLLNQMIRGDLKASTKEMDLQAWRLETLFKDDWSDKADNKQESAFAALSEEDLIKLINSLIDKHKATLDALRDS